MCTDSPEPSLLEHKFPFEPAHACDDCSRAACINDTKIAIFASMRFNLSQCEVNMALASLHICTGSSEP